MSKHGAESSFSSHGRSDRSNSPLEDGDPPRKRRPKRKLKEGKKAEKNREYVRVCRKRREDEKADLEPKVLEATREAQKAKQTLVTYQTFAQELQEAPALPIVEVAHHRTDLSLTCGGWGAPNHLTVKQVRDATPDQINCYFTALMTAICMEGHKAKQDLQFWGPAGFSIAQNRARLEALDGELKDLSNMVVAYNPDALREVMAADRDSGLDLDRLIKRLELEPEQWKRICDLRKSYDNFAYETGETSLQKQHRLLSSLRAAVTECNRQREDPFGIDILQHRQVQYEASRLMREWEEFDCREDSRAFAFRNAVLYEVLDLEQRARYFGAHATFQQMPDVLAMTSRIVAQAEPGASGPLQAAVPRVSVGAGGLAPAAEADGTAGGMAPSAGDASLVDYDPRLDGLFLMSSEVEWLSPPHCRLESPVPQLLSGITADAISPR